MSDSFEPIFKITPGVQSYDWGKIGSTSLTAQFADKCIDGFVTQDDKPYAEASRKTSVWHVNAIC
jgi:mannose-6-phosphate isomerase class I